MFQILFLLAALGVFKAIMEIRKTYTCPTEKTLQKVIKGLEKNESTKSLVTRHLGVCDKCRSKISQPNS